MFGEPRIERADTAAPAISSITRRPDGFLIVFTEPVLPRLVGGTTDEFATATDPLGTIIDVVGFTGQTALAEEAAGVPFGHAVFFRGVIPEAASVTVNIAGNSLEDEWGNAVAAGSTTFTFSGPVGGTLFTGAAIGSTRAQTSSRSVVGNPMLFHGQYFDYDAGLLYLRARHYDPFTGTFLQRDPAGYEDSPNPYAAFRHNPLRYRDPTGQFVIVLVPIAIAKGAAIGAVIGAGIDAWMQIAGWGASGNFTAAASKGYDWKRGLSAAAGGAVSGGLGSVASATGTSLGAARIFSAGGDVVAGMASRAAAGAEVLNARDMLRDLVIGALAFEAGRGLGGAGGQAGARRPASPAARAYEDAPRVGPGVAGAHPDLQRIVANVNGPGMRDVIQSLEGAAPISSASRSWLAGKKGGTGVLGLFHRKSGIAFYADDLVPGSAEYINTIYHERAHAWMQNLTGARGIGGYRGLNALAEEFLANIHGTYAEMVQLGVNSADRSTARLILENEGFDGMMRRILNDYKDVIGTATVEEARQQLRVYGYNINP
jgi:RHS repeat-associated protein